MHQLPRQRRLWSTQSESALARCSKHVITIALPIRCALSAYRHLERESYSSRFGNRPTPKSQCFPRLVLGAVPTPAPRGGGANHCKDGGDLPSRRSGDHASTQSPVASADRACRAHAGHRRYRDWTHERIFARRRGAAQFAEIRLSAPGRPRHIRPVPQASRGRARFRWRAHLVANRPRLAAW